MQLKEEITVILNKEEIVNAIRNYIKLTYPEFEVLGIVPYTSNIAGERIQEPGNTRLNWLETKIIRNSK